MQSLKEEDRRVLSLCAKGKRPGEMEVVLLTMGLELNTNAKLLGRQAGRDESWGPRRRLSVLGFASEGAEMTGIEICSSLEIGSILMFSP